MATKTATKTATKRTVTAVAHRPGTVETSVPLPDALEKIAHEISGAIIEAETVGQSLNATLGELAIKAAKYATPTNLGAFIGACKQLCDASTAVTVESTKVYLSRLRGVIKDMIEKAYKPAKTGGLKAMYRDRPSATTRASSGARHGTDSADAATPAAPKPATFEDLVRGLFGTFTPELGAAVDYAIEHSGMFMSWASSSAKAAQIAEIEKLGAQVPVIGSPQKPAEPAKTRRTRKAA
ncbi:hypothetical protein [Candidimonas nitroreducens]|uniref:Uncharacterized protein n=1 Tax=Candidimonas nitroreducens TaxID=683354 RepID=A0A225M1Q8_9BURK|nr:hypothetical protein [Candidimonas nitroreducens]OWT55257.1 hypothetical protein CEY11_21340 [Candidimonas nitroreducens]